MKNAEYAATYFYPLEYDKDAALREVVTNINNLDVNECKITIAFVTDEEYKKDNSIVEIPNNRGQIIRIGGSRLVSIAGPCAVESREQMMSVAKKVAASGAVMLRGGAYKPRTSPYAFQGLAEEGLQYLKEAGDAYGLPVVTECVSAEHLDAMIKYKIDCLQIGARNMQNFELLKEVGKTLEKYLAE